jgi:hypothetical protein
MVQYLIHKAEIAQVGATVPETDPECARSELLGPYRMAWNAIESVSPDQELFDGIRTSTEMVLPMSALQELRNRYPESGFLGRSGFNTSDPDTGLEVERYVSASLVLRTVIQGMDGSRILIDVSPADRSAAELYAVGRNARFIDLTLSGLKEARRFVNNPSAAAEAQATATAQPR